MNVFNLGTFSQLKVQTEVDLIRSILVSHSNCALKKSVCIRTSYYYHLRTYIWQWLVFRGAYSLSTLGAPKNCPLPWRLNCHRQYPMGSKIGSRPRPPSSARLNFGPQIMIRVTVHACYFWFRLNSKRQEVLTKQGRCEMALRAIFFFARQDEAGSHSPHTLWLREGMPRAWTNHF